MVYRGHSNSFPAELQQLGFRSILQVARHSLQRDLASETLGEADVLVACQGNTTRWACLKIGGNAPPLPPKIKGAWFRVGFPLYPFPFKPTQTKIYGRLQKALRQTNGCSAEAPPAW